MSCQINKGKFYAPNGEESILYKELEQKVGKEQAKNLFVLSYTPSFRKQFYKSINIKNTERGFETKIKDTTINFKSRINPITNKEVKGIDLELITTPEEYRGKGSAREALKTFLDYTDQIGEDVYLTIQPRDKKTDFEKLKNFYKSLGFYLEPSGFEMRRNRKKSLIFDKNGEVISDKVIEYARQQKENESSLNGIEQIEIKKIMSEFPNIENSEELSNILEKAFYNKGIFNPNRQSLLKSDLYSEYEINNILNDIQLQAIIKDSLERLKNTEKIENKPYPFKEEFKIKSTETNIFGKLQLNNPLKLENTVIKNPDQTDFLLKEEYVAIPVIDENGKFLETSIVYDEAVKVVEKNSPIFEAIDALIEAPDVLDTSKLEDKLVKWLYNYGIDIKGFTKDLLPSLKSFLNDPTDSTAFSEKYKEVFKIKDSFKKEYVKISQKERDYVYLETSKSEKELFDTMSLLKTDTNNVYHRIEKVDLEELRNYLNLDNTVSEIDSYKKYFNYKNIKPVEQNINFLDFSGDVEYLTNEFIADFNVARLLNKGNEFFDSFKITEKGIELISNDELTLDIVKEYLKSDIELGKELKQYSLLSKHLPNLIEITPSIQNRENSRIQFINNPNLLEESNKTFQVIDEDFISVINPTEDFIKVNNAIYELENRQGNEGVYSKLEINMDNNYYNFSPKTVDNIPYKTSPKLEKYNSVKKLWNEEVEKNFDCFG